MRDTEALQKIRDYISKETQEQRDTIEFYLLHKQNIVNYQVFIYGAREVLAVLENIDKIIKD